MITETIYQKADLITGECTSCSEKSDKIIPSEGRCVDCVEEEKFYDETMKFQNNGLKYF
jgi:hypothetical protein